MHGRAAERVLFAFHVSSRRVYVAHVKSNPPGSCCVQAAFEPASVVRGGRAAAHDVIADTVLSTQSVRSRGLGLSMYSTLVLNAPSRALERVV